MKKKIIILIFAIVFLFSSINFVFGINDPMFDDVIGVWKLDETSGSLNNSITGKLESVYGSPTYGVFGKSGTAINFSLATTYANLTELNGTRPATFTYSIWFYQVAGLEQDLFGTNGAGNRHLCYAKDDDTILCRVKTSTNVDCTGAIVGTGWKNLIYMGNGSQTTCYIDGNLLDTRSWSTAVTIPAYEFKLGTMTSGGKGSGLIDEFYVWNRALNSSEITKLQTTFYSIIPPPVPTNNINISIPNPLNESQYNINLLHINATVNSTQDFTCDLNVNSSIIETKSFFSGTDILVDFNITYISSIEGLYNYSIYCQQITNSTQNETTETYQYIIDNVMPSISSTIDKNNTYWTRELSLNISINETFFHSIIINGSCNTNYYNSSLTNPFILSFLTTNCSLGLQTTNITICDGYFSALNCRNYDYTWTNMGMLNVTGSLWNNTNLTSFKIYVNGTLDGSTTNGYYEIKNLTSGKTYLIELNQSGVQIINYTYYVSSAYEDYRFIGYTSESFNITIYDEKSLELLTTKNVTVEFISEFASYNYTTDTGKLYVDLLIPGNYLIRYYAEGYGRNRHMYYTLTQQSHNVIDLYLLNSTEDVTVTVYDRLTLLEVPNSFVYLLRYEITTNSYINVAQCQADIAGKCYFDVEKETELYKFLVDYPFGTRLLETSEQYIEANEINLYIDTTTSAVTPFYERESIIYSINANRNDRTFSITYTDPGIIAENYCFYIKQTGYYSDTVVNFTCSSSSSSSFTLSGMDENITYYALFTIFQDGVEVPIATGFIEFLSSELDSGTFGIFLAIIIIMVLVFVSQVHVLAMILMSVGLLFIKMIGILNVGWGYIIGLVISSIIVSIMLELRK